MNKFEQALVEPVLLSRIRIHLTGLIQGVGFRPHIFKLARARNVQGFVLNTSRGVTIEAEAEPSRLESFFEAIQVDLPPHSEIHSLVRQFVAPTGQQGFHINESHQSGEVVPLVLPDIAVCPECLKEMLDPADRRFGYPFINCTHCGPRISILDSLPYDRPNTTMAHFALCPDCRAEYEDPKDRRFHAQPIACPICGPQLAFHEKPGEPATATKQDALDHAIESLERGEILALKGLGGFQLLADAANAQTVRRLRIRKRRGNKPFAVMFPDMEAVRKAAICSAAEEKLMKSSEAPIVLVLKGNDHFEAAAPRNLYLGVFLPYTPLHHLLLQGFGRPVIATSGNKFNEPICISNEEAFDRLRHLADTFLVHDRPIERAVDDSVTRIVNAEPFIIRRARGFAPLPIRLKETLPDSLAVGGHLKNTIAAGKKNQIILSQHIGNLDTVESVRAHQRAKEDFKKLYGLKPAKVVVDDHPDYVSRQFALKEPEAGVISIQHHLAHVFSCMAEHGLKPPLLGISWDGTGYGTDGTIWGAESFHLTETGTRRCASILPFRLPGGEAAIREVGRIALSLSIASDCSWETNVKNQFFAGLIEKEVNAPVCSSMGRLFDGISALLGLCMKTDFEGEAAMSLEFEAINSTTREAYPITWLQETPDSPPRWDWRPMIRAIQRDLAENRTVSEIARQFHNTLAQYALEVAQRSGEARVVLSGGCFQNKLLSELIVRRLEEAGFEVYWHKWIPANDGGLAAGQLYATLFEQNLKIR